MCPYCGAPVPAGAKVCPRCGRALPSVRHLVKCRTCGARVSADLKVCPMCGDDLRPAPRRWPWVIVFVVLLVGGFLWQRGNMVSAVGWLVGKEQSLKPPNISGFILYIPTPAWVSTPQGFVAPSATVTPTFTITSTASFRYPAPTLLSPRDGDSYNGRGASIELEWQPVGALADDEVYRITLRYIREGQPVSRVVTTRGSHWRVDPSLFGQADQPDRAYKWSVRVVVVHGDSAVPVSPPSREFEFHWH